jgi:hypothetical protein
MSSDGGEILQLISTKIGRTVLIPGERFDRIFKEWRLVLRSGFQFPVVFLHYVERLLPLTTV